MCKYNDMDISVGRHQAIIIMRTLLNMHDLPRTSEVLQFLLITFFVLLTLQMTNIIILYRFTKNVFIFIFNIHTTYSIIWFW